MVDLGSNKLKRIKKLLRDGKVVLHHTADDFVEFERSLAKTGRAAAGSVEGFKAMSDTADAFGLAARAMGVRGLKTEMENHLDVMGLDEFERAAVFRAADAFAKTSPAVWHVAFKQHVTDAAAQWNNVGLETETDEVDGDGDFWVRSDEATTVVFVDEEGHDKLSPEHVRPCSSRSLDLGPAIPGPDFFKLKGKPLPEGWEVDPDTKSLDVDD